MAGTCGICGEQNGLKTSFLRILWVSPVSIISHNECVTYFSYILKMGSCGREKLKENKFEVAVCACSLHMYIFVIWM